MVIKHNLSECMLLMLVKDFSSEHTVTSLARNLKVSRVGIWKILKKLEVEEMIKLEQVGTGKTSVFKVRLFWNKILKKALAFYLIKETSKYKRWVWDFKELEKYVDFAILYGSILYSKEAKDIDIINVTSKKRFNKIDKVLEEMQIIQPKKIHDINFTLTEFKSELRKPNKAFIDAIRKGVVLFGHEKFVNFAEELRDD